MIKRKAFFIWLLILIINIFLVSSTPILNETFESNNLISPNVWFDKDGGNITITNTSVLAGAYSGRYGAVDWGYSLVNFTNQTSGNFTISFMFNRSVDEVGFIVARNPSPTAWYYQNGFFTLCGYPVANVWGYITTASAYYSTNLSCLYYQNITLLFSGLGTDTKMTIKVNDSFSNVTSDEVGAALSLGSFGYIRRVGGLAITDNICACPGNWNTTCCEAAGAAPSDFFNISAFDAYNTSNITNFSVTLNNGSTYSTINGSIKPGWYINHSSLESFNISSDFNGGYHNVTITDLNVSNHLNIGLYKYFRLLTEYYNFTGYNNTNYSRSLIINLNISCPSFSNTTYNIYVNNTLNISGAAPCINNFSNQNISFNPSDESRLFFNTSISTDYNPAINNLTTNNKTFLFDLFNPTIRVLNFSTNTTFNTSLYASINMICEDSIMSLLEYNASFNAVNIIALSNYTNNTLAYNSSSFIDGINYLNASCRDLFGTTSRVYSSGLYFKTLCLIDERDNTLFNASNTTSTRAYIDDNSTYFDFTYNNVSCINYSSGNSTALRFELFYIDGRIIQRYIDTSFLPSDIRVCANKDDIQHYEQLLISSTQRVTGLKSLFSNCYVGADYTRFAYQDAYLLKAYTSANLYYVYTYNGSSLIYLTSLDGTIATYINLDTLDFKSTAFKINLLDDVLIFANNGTNLTKIFYFNSKNNNLAANIEILRMDTYTTIFNSSTYSNPNNITLYFDTSTLLGVNETTIYRIIVSATRSTGETEQIIRYFTGSGKSGFLSAPLAFVMSLLVLVFGLTFAASKITFSWFGILIELIAIVIAASAIWTWYILFLLAVEVIVFIFTIILMISTGQRTLTGGVN